MSRRDKPRLTAQTKLAQRRVACDLKQSEVAAAASLSLPTYRRLERGEIDGPPLRYLVNCATALGCKYTDLIEPEWLERKPLGAEKQRLTRPR